MARGEDERRTLLRDRTDRLGAAVLASATDRDDGVALLLEFYERVLPFVPAERTRFSPWDDDVTSVLLGRITDDERARLAIAMETACRSAPSRRGRILFEVVLCGAILVDAGRLSHDLDPTVPLMALFERGYELEQDHGFIEVWDRIGGRRVPIPTRAQIEARRAGAGSRPG